MDFISNSDNFGGGRGPHAGVNTAPLGFGVFRGGLFIDYVTRLLAVIRSTRNIKSLLAF